MRCSKAQVENAIENENEHQVENWVENRGVRVRGVRGPGARLPVFPEGRALVHPLAGTSRADTEKSVPWK